MYKDSLMSGSGVMEEGNVEDLISLAKAAVKKTKTQLETVMTRHLAIADPRNGPEFIKEVRKFKTFGIVSSLHWASELSVGSMKSQCVLALISEVRNV